MYKKEVTILLLSIIFICLIINPIHAINLDISSKPVSNSVIIDLKKPATFDLLVRNLGPDDTFEFYSLTGIDIYPIDGIRINSGQTKIITIEVMPQESLFSKQGLFTFVYKIRNSNNEIQEEQLTINIAELSDAFSVTAGSINPSSGNVDIDIKNNLMYNFTKVDLMVTSAFSEHSRTINLEPFESKLIHVPVNREKIKSLNAGNYLININFLVENKEVTKEAIVKFLEEENIDSSIDSAGILVQTKEINKRNLGNVRKSIIITEKKNLLSSLFTSTNIPPSAKKITGFSVVYDWNKELIPNEDFKVTIKTNWFYPIVVLILLFVVIMVVKYSRESDIDLRKKVTFVKTKGGQFALKVMIRVKAKKFAEKIVIIDKLPPLVKLYEKFGMIPPNKIDMANRRLEWEIETLAKGEERVFTYIIYSKVGVVGKFELPNARASYDKEGKVKSTQSNRAFYINDPNIS